MKAKTICTRAAALVDHGRRAQHGDAAENHAAIAAVWQGILAAAGKAPAVPLDAHDGAGYAAVAGEIRAGRERAPPPARRRRR